MMVRRNGRFAKTNKPGNPGQFGKKLDSVIANEDTSFPGVCIEVLVEVPPGIAISGYIGDVYIFHSMHNDRPAVFSRTWEKYLYFHEYGYWMIGNTLGVNGAFVSVYSHVVNPEDAQLTKNWTYWGDNQWNVEPRINVTCLNETTMFVPDPTTAAMETTVSQSTTLVTGSVTLTTTEYESTTLVTDSVTLATTENESTTVVTDSITLATTEDESSTLATDSVTIATTTEASFPGVCIEVLVEVPPGIAISGFIGDVYIFHSMHNDKPAVFSSAKDKYLYFHEYGYWMIGNTLGANSAFVTVASRVVNPEDVKLTKNWTYWGNSQWNEEPRINITCLNETIVFVPDPTTAAMETTVSQSATLATESVTLATEDVTTTESTTTMITIDVTPDLQENATEPGYKRAKRIVWEPSEAEGADAMGSMWLILVICAIIGIVLLDVGKLTKHLKRAYKNIKFGCDKNSVERHKGPASVLCSDQPVHHIPSPYIETEQIHDTPSVSGDSPHKNSEFKDTPLGNSPSKYITYKTPPDSPNMDTINELSEEQVDAERRLSKLSLTSLCKDITNLDPRQSSDV
ncbi:unnamed protein product [Owenia fusiformis]|uniref:Uncharacterized protein n=1 Tax=Owenia fusiformis TaxID=6347 RepID=A0A8S4PS87_OWEFU|nr:unnamed protein product [Owenia fusiformis]